jgi:deoxyhypusine synthase
MGTDGVISGFLENNFTHFNAGELLRASKEYDRFIKSGGKMMITLAGAMSTAEIGKLLAELIRKDKVHIISCTGANLEEDVYNLIAHSNYINLPNYKELSSLEDENFYKKGLNRITDVCIPEKQTMQLIEESLTELWVIDSNSNRVSFPHQYFFRLFDEEKLITNFNIDPQNSWVYAAWEKNIPLIVPGWEDSTTGNKFASMCYSGKISSTILKTGNDYMQFLIDWYIKNSQDSDIGFFQIGGGIAGDFPICVVPLLAKDLGIESTKMWKYYCQISDSTTSYGSYSGAPPNEKISWGKLEIGTPKYMIESDATIVFPLMSAYILNL